eukprot:ANDGO_07595.mRNA.1 hypothetical protein
MERPLPFSEDDLATPKSKAGVPFLLPPPLVARTISRYGHQQPSFQATTAEWSVDWVRVSRWRRGQSVSMMLKDYCMLVTLVMGVIGLILSLYTFILFYKWSTDANKILFGEFRASAASSVRRYVAIGWSDVFFFSPAFAAFNGPMIFMQPLKVSSVASFGVSPVLNAVNVPGLMDTQSKVVAQSGLLRASAGFSKDVHLGTAMQIGSNLSVVGNVRTKNVFVTGISFLDGPFTADVPLEFSGIGTFSAQSSFSNVLESLNDAFFGCPVAIQNSLVVSNRTEALEPVIAKDRSFLLSNSTFSNLFLVEDAFLVWYENLTLRGLSNFTSSAVFEGVVEFSGPSDFRSTLLAGGDLYNSGSIFVLGSTFWNASALIRGDFDLHANYSSAGPLTLSNGAVVVGNTVVSLRTRATNVHVSPLASFLSSSNTTFSGPLTVHNTSLLGGTLVSFSSLKILHGPSIFDGPLELQSKFNVTASLNVRGRANITSFTMMSAASSAASLRVHSNATVRAAVSIMGLSEFFSPVLLSSNLSVRGASQVYGNAIFVGNADVRGNMILYGHAYAYGSVDFGSALRVLGSVGCADIVHVLGSSSFMNSLVAQRSFVSNSSLHAALDIAVQGNLSVSGDVVSGGNAMFRSSLFVSNASLLVGPVSVQNAMTVSSNVTASGDAFLRASLSVAGASTFSGNVTVGGAMFAGGNVQFRGPLRIYQNLSFARIAPAFYNNVSVFGRPSRFVEDGSFGELWVDQSSSLTVFGKAMLKSTVVSRNFVNFSGSSLSVLGDVGVLGSSSASSSMLTRVVATKIALVGSLRSAGIGTFEALATFSRNLTMSGGLLFQSTGNLTVAAPLVIDAGFLALFLGPVYVRSSWLLQSTVLFLGATVLRGPTFISTTSAGVANAAQFTNLATYSRTNLQGPVSFSGPAVIQDVFTIEVSGSFTKSAAGTTQMLSRADFVGPSNINAALSVNGPAFFFNQWTISGVSSGLNVYPVAAINGPATINLADFKQSVFFWKPARIDSVTGSSTAAVLVTGMTSVTYNVNFNAYTTTRINGQFQLSGKSTAGLVQPSFQIDSRISQFGPPYYVYRWVSGSPSVAKAVGCWKIKIAGNTRCLLFEIQ